jgi:hypothetical protein
MRKLAYLSIPFIALSACSQRPSESQAKQVFEAQLARQLGATPYTIVSFEKTNGQDVNMMGVPMYRFFYSAQVSLPEGFRPECVQHGNQFAGFNCMMQFADPTGIRPQERGAVMPRTGEIDFQKTENGWTS